MKAILEFELPEEADAFEEAEQGALLKAAIQKFDNMLRDKVKYDGNLLPNLRYGYEDTRALLASCLRSKGIDLW